MQISTRHAHRDEGPWAIICPVHGHVALHKEEYDAQMNNPNALWACPLCGETSQWNDDRYDDFYGKLDPTL